MKTKIIVSVVLLVVLIFVNAVSGLVAPEVSTSLALEQFKNPSVTTDTAMRTYNTFSPLWYAFAGWVLLNLFLFRDKIKEMLYA